MSSTNQKKRFEETLQWIKDLRTASLERDDERVMEMIQPWDGKPEWSIADPDYDFALHTTVGSIVIQSIISVDAPLWVCYIGDQRHGEFVVTFLGGEYATMGNDSVLDRILEYIRG